MLNKSGLWWFWCSSLGSQGRCFMCCYFWKSLSVFWLKILFVCLFVSFDFVTVTLHLCWVHFWKSVYKIWLNEDVNSHQVLKFHLDPHISCRMYQLLLWDACDPIRILGYFSQRTCSDKNRKIRINIFVWVWSTGIKLISEFKEIALWSRVLSFSWLLSLHLLKLKEGDYESMMIIFLLDIVSFCSDLHNDQESLPHSSIFITGSCLPPTVFTQLVDELDKETKHQWISRRREAENETIEGFDSLNTEDFGYAHLDHISFSVWHWLYGVKLLFVSSLGFP